MKNLFFASILLSTLFVTSCKDDKETYEETYEEIVAVANRDAGSITLINAKKNVVTNTISIPNSEPMYVVYVSSRDRLYVGDRSGNKIHIINLKTKTIENSITVGNGVFHMWADGQGKQLWVNNDVDNTISVIDLATNTVVKTINVGMKPHDVFVTKDSSTAYVSVLNSDDSKPDKIYSYSTSTYSKTGEASVGKDPHLFHLPNSNKLYVPCQSGQLYTLSGNNLSQISNNSFEGAHGIFASSNQSTIFMTNISGQKLYSVNASTSVINGTTVNAISATPHNIVTNESGDKLFATHSGGSAKTVSTYTVSGTNITAGETITTDTNPFGITYYKRSVN